MLRKEPRHGPTLVPRHVWLICLVWAPAILSCDDAEPHGNDVASELVGDSDVVEIVEIDDTPQAEDTRIPPGCATGMTDCGGTCTFLSRDPANCGGCGRSCREGEVCLESACAPECPADSVKCGAWCVDPLSDREHCGAGDDCELEPGLACSTGEVCSAGVCSLSCQSDLVECFGVCVDTDTEREHCGGCADGTGTHRCGAGEICEDGLCIPTCQEGMTTCGGECVDVLSDTRYCSPSIGQCGSECPLDHVCEAGVCTPRCTGVTVQCGDICVDVLLDPANCGGCGDDDSAFVCTQTDDSYAYCSAGVCRSVDCPGGFGNCDHDPANVCEADLSGGASCN